MILRSAQLAKKRGFTLIELMVSVTILALVAGVGIASYSTFNNKQKLVADGKQFSQFLRTAQKRIKSGDKGSCIAAQTIVSYQVITIVSANRAVLNYQCSSGPLAPGPEIVLPNNSTFLTSKTVTFFPLTASLLSEETIDIVNTNVPGKLYRVKVDKNGSISDVGVL